MMSVSKPLWTEKYRPKTTEEITVNGLRAKELLTWVKAWMKSIPQRRAVLLYGPPGTGKTASVYAIANQLNIDLLEVNASDKRNAEQIKNIVGTAAVQTSLFSSKIRLILIDEVDGIAGNEDRGGINELCKIIKSSLNPIIMTANDPWSPHLRGVRELSLLVQYRRAASASIVSILKGICRSEGIDFEEEALGKIAAASGGDIRSAINDLQFFGEGVKKLRVEEITYYGERDRTGQIFDALKRLFEAHDMNTAKKSFDIVDMDYDLFFKWVAENANLHAKTPEETKMAFDNLSKADKFMRRILKTNNWGLFRYFTSLMTAGVALSVTDKYGYKKYQFPSWINKLSSTKKERDYSDKISLKIKLKCHLGIKKIRAHILPFLKIIFQSNNEEATKLSHYFGFEEEEQTYLAGGKLQSGIHTAVELKFSS